MNEWENELGILMYVNILKALKQHCLEQILCDSCVFRAPSGCCLLHVSPCDYNIDLIEKAIREDIKKSLKDGDNNGHR